MQSKTKTLTVKEIFCGMPFLRNYFQEQERIIRKFAVGADANPAVKELKEKKKALLTTAKELTVEDLKIIFYIKNLSNRRVFRILKCLQNLYDAECALKDSLNVKSNEPSVESNTQF